MLSWRTARRTSGTTTAIAVLLALLIPTPAVADGTEVTGRAPGAVAPPPVAAAAAPAPPPDVDVKTTEVPPAAPEPGTSGVVAELPETDTDSFRMVGVTWSGDASAAGVVVEVRTRSEGQWSSWTALDVDAGDGTGQPGTEPLWVDDADGVAARVTSQSGTPQDVKISTIDPGGEDQVLEGDTEISGASWTGPLDGVARATTAASTDGSPAYSPMPSIISRSSWGASAGTPCDTPAAGDSTRGVVVHHTAGTNSYPKSQSAAIVRATQAYHVKSRKWCDLGYNFLVDKYGQIFEGRRGGMDRAVRAAHSGNAAVNTYTMGVSMMGNYDLVKPTSALKTAMVKLIGWRMGTNYLPAKGTYSLGGKKLNMIAGHRDVLSTACPGRYGYAWLSEKGGLRDRVEGYLKSYSTPVKTRYRALGAAKVGPIFIGESKSSKGARLRGKSMDVYSQGSSKSAFFVSGALRTEYNRVGARTGAFGYPSSDPTAVTGATRQVFQKGRLYQVGSKAYSVQGDIAAAYVKVGETAGQLGVPTSSTSTVSSGVTRVNFAKGYILANASTKIATAYSSNGAVLGQTSSVARPATVGALTVKAGRHSARVRWPAAGNSTSYDVCLVSKTTQTKCSRAYSKVAATSKLIPKLKPKTGSTHYYVKVRGRNANGIGAYSAPKGFAMVTSSAPAPSASAAPSSSNSRTVPSSGKITVKGHGYGHGIGMSQYGAQGAARQGVGFSKILSTYYPGTTIAKKSGSIRVLITEDTSVPVDVKATSGLVFRKMTSSFRAALPTTIDGAKVTSWRITPVSSRKTQSVLQYRTSGSYRSYRDIRWTGDGQFEGPSRISLQLPGGKVVKYRGAIRSAVPTKGSTTRKTVNVLPIEHYVRGVIAAEMPAGWHPEALKAQAVAARTYGVRSLAPSRYYDICNTTSCQVYGGASRETTSTDAAVRATKGQYLAYKGAPALTQFSSSSGGRTSVGSQPYLKAAADPYDKWSGNPNHAWTTTVTASRIQSAYPAIGTLKKLTVSKRTGGGAMGGRVSTVKLVGSARTVTITGNDARWAFGLKSNWFGF